MKKLITVAFIICLAFGICACGEEAESSESSGDNGVFEFEDITLTLSDKWNCVDLMAAGDGCYEKFSMKDEEGFIDERAILSGESLPIFIHCLYVKDPDYSMDDLIEAYEQGLAEEDWQEVSVNDNPALKTYYEFESEDGEKYQDVSVVFIVNGKMYVVHTFTSENISDKDLNEVLSGISY